MLKEKAILGLIENLKPYTSLNIILKDGTVFEARKSLNIVYYILNSELADSMHFCGIKESDLVTIYTSLGVFYKPKQNIKGAI